jgi:nicotinate-nucleotide pyrophosphorylase (carboxylating)
VEAKAPALEQIREQVRLALLEDVGSGDRTAMLLPSEVISSAQLICRQAAVICGRPWFDETFRQLDPAVAIHWLVEEGARVTPGSQICELRGNTRALLTAERTALNYLQTLSGTATRVQAYVEAIRGTGARILDTRKTLPGLRVQQKYAVACGGGCNHRFGLYDAILIKENHIEAAGSITAALAAAAKSAPDLEIEVEVEDIPALKEALAAGARRILLDNFDLDQLRQAVAITAGRARLEASGGVTLAGVRAIAETGVDDISVGGLTKDVMAVDLSLRFV